MNDKAAEARRLRLNQALKSLANWAEARSNGNHNTETTLTMLIHRVSEIKDQVDRAGWAASNSNP
jgi:L-lactate utilization protein LutB